MEEEQSPKPPNQEQLSGVTVVIIIGIGVQTIIILVIFVKRQITRFALRGRRGPHVSVGQGGLKPLRKEIDRRIEYAAHIRHEPKIDCSDNPDLRHNNIRFRVAAVDRVTELDMLLGQYDPEFWRSPGANLRSYLIECMAGPLVGIEPKTIHAFCDLYDHARHDYKPFLEQEFDRYVAALQDLKTQVTNNIQNKPTTPKKVASTPNHRRALNRPRRRILAVDGEGVGGGEGTDTVVVHRNSSTVLLSADTLSKTNSTSV